MIVIHDDSSDDDEHKLPMLFNRVRSPTKQQLESPKTVKVVTLPRDAGEDAPEPAWMAKFKSPDAGMVAALASSSSSSSDDEADAALTAPTVEGKENSERRARASKIDAETSAGGTIEKQPLTPARKPTSAVGMVAPKAPIEGSSTSIELVIPATTHGKSKVLFEIEGSGEAIDLDGDTGAVGRWLAEGSRSLKVDMKGVMYNARVVPCAGTVVIVAVGSDVAKVESIHREYVQLREDPNAMGGMENFGVGSLFDADIGDETGDADAAPEASNKRKRGADSAAAKPRKPAAKRKPATKKSKTKPRARK